MGTQRSMHLLGIAIFLSELEILPSHYLKGWGLDYLAGWLPTRLSPVVSQVGS